MSELMGATVKGPGLKPAESMGVIRGAEAPRSLREAIECVPQRLKPDSLGYACGTAEAVPLSKTTTEILDCGQSRMTDKRATADSSAALRNDKQGALRNDKQGALRNDKQKSDKPIVDDEEDSTPFDKLREECGIMAVYGHPDAARMTYWGLYALQHRGQESAGIASADGQEVNDIKGMGLVSEIFTDEVLERLPGHMAIGHTRYSTTGDSALLNAQPISVESTKGLIAIAHNG
ncbi:MAG: hypothetical protein ABSF57_12410, partial [Acidobacteriaceae bacterium]